VKRRRQNVIRRNGIRRKIIASTFTALNYVLYVNLSKNVHLIWNKSVDYLYFTKISCFFVWLAFECDFFCFCTSIIGWYCLRMSGFIKTFLIIFYKNGTCLKNAYCAVVFQWEMNQMVHGCNAYKNFFRISWCDPASTSTAKNECAKFAVKLLSNIFH